ncbi:nuclear transport factor 2 family protein [Amycolatopsis silviterrae]|uniref:Nuclear transport factor 2 family protein n=1 Tax=Amycolatopsis silviterrae TaxID=1656914 RepID=A0ABW5HCH5_9PSEU
MTVSGELYQEIQQYYAWQMQLLDQARTDEWAETFTEDGVFEANAAPAPVKGRSAIAAASAATHRQLAEVHELRRHWLGMLTVEPGETADKLHTRCYALIIATRKGGEPRIHCSTLCEDVLVRVGDSWQVEYRTVSRDDIR